MKVALFAYFNRPIPDNLAGQILAQNDPNSCRTTYSGQKPIATRLNFQPAIFPGRHALNGAAPDLWPYGWRTNAFEGSFCVVS